jgi:hypothetical protein
MSFITNMEQLKVIENFVADLEKSMRVNTTESPSTELWDSDPPEHAKGQSLQEYMKDVSRFSKREEHGPDK